MIRIHLDFDPVARAMQEVEIAIEEEMENALQEVGYAVAIEARTNHRFTNRTGKLSRAIQAEDVTGSFYGRDLTVEVVADTPYARFVHDGTKPHPIHAKRRKALRYVQNGRVMFRRSVQHPGTKPTYFLSEALERLFPEATAKAERATANAFKRAGFEVA